MQKDPVPQQERCLMLVPSFIRAQGAGGGRKGFHLQLMADL